MSVGPVHSNSTQVLAQALLQQLQSTGGGALDASGQSGALNDLLSLSPMAQQLSQVPSGVTQAVTDLLAGKSAAPADLSQLQAYLQNNPQGLPALLASVQGNAGTYGVAGSLTSKDAVLTALLNQQSSQSNPTSLLSLLDASQSSDPLVSTLGNQGNRSTSAFASLFG